MPRNLYKKSSLISGKTTLSYAAIFGIKTDLNLVGTEYSWLSRYDFPPNRKKTTLTVRVVSFISAGWPGQSPRTLSCNVSHQHIISQQTSSCGVRYLCKSWQQWIMIDGDLIKMFRCEAAANNFSSLAALRVLSGAFEAIADPALVYLFLDFTYLSTESTVRFMLITSMFYTRAEQPSRISCWYAFNGIGVAGGGLIVSGTLVHWRKFNPEHRDTGSEISKVPSLHGDTSQSHKLISPRPRIWQLIHTRFLIVGAFCAAWGIVLLLLLPNSPATVKGFSHDEKLMMIARMRKNQTGVENRVIKWDQVVETFTDYKTVRVSSLVFSA